MAKTRTKDKDKYNEFSYARYTVRFRKDSCLHDDVEHFMATKGTSLDYLVNKLLSNHFQSIHYSDPSYPV